MKEKRWVKPATDEVKVAALHAEIKSNKLFSELLIRRGIDTFDDAKSFFNPCLSQLHDPLGMKDMDKALSRITTALHKAESILVYGDYDVDGTTSVAMMSTFLKQFTDQVECYIPDRYKEGYGVSAQGIDYAKNNKVDLIITIDCGITAMEQVDRANLFGIDVIICDHHTPKDIVPKAHAILNPKQVDCAYPYKELSGCGVAFKLAQAYTEANKLDKEKLLYPLLDYVAISSACDIVPITGENRVLTHFGLAEINKTSRLSIKVLRETNAVNLPLGVSDVVFKIGPLINAAGRLSDAKDAVRLLTTKNLAIAEELSTLLVKQNKRRQEIDKTISAEAIAFHAQDPHVDDLPCVVEYNPTWHKGVIGIAASRVVEHYYKPAIIFTESNGKYVASARSVKDFNIYDAIAHCSDHYENFGGHKYAAGITLHPDQYKAFKKAFTEGVKQTITAEQLVPEIVVDGTLDPTQITMQFYKTLQRFAPFGPSNRSPVFMAQNVDCSKHRILKDLHLKCTIGAGSQQIDAIGFNLAEQVKGYIDEPVDLCYAIDINEWRGVRKLQLIIKDIKPSTV